MIGKVVTVLAMLALLSNATCLTSTVDPMATADTPAYVAASSGITSDDTLTLIFNWNTYGSETAIAYRAASGLVCKDVALCASVGDEGAPTGAFVRYVDTANTGFVNRFDAAALCTAHSLASGLAASSSIVAYASNTYPSGVCPADYTQQVETWTTVKGACGSNYFPSTAAGGTYEVAFTYRVTYIESLPGGDTRSVSNDYPFVVTSPTSFNVTSQQYLVAGVSTQILAQQVRVDKVSGSIAVHVTAIAACGNTFATPTLPANATADFPLSATLSRTFPSAVVRTKLFTTITSAASVSDTTILVHDASAFPTSGSVTVVDASGGSTIVLYSSKTPTSLTLPTGLAAAFAVGNTVLLNAASTTVSVGALLTNSPTMTVADNSLFASSGKFALSISGKIYVVSYTGKSGSDFIGCTTLDGSVGIPSDTTVTELDVYKSGLYTGLCANSWVTVVQLADSGACSLSGTVNALYSIVPAGSTVSFTSPASSHFCFSSVSLNTDCCIAR